MNVAALRFQDPERIAWGPQRQIPPYYLSVASQDLKERQARWEKERGAKRDRPKKKPWNAPAAYEPGAGRILYIGTKGEVLADTSQDFVHGLLPHTNGMLVAQHHHIHHFTPDLTPMDTFARHNSLNDIHTLRKTKHGILIAASGTDTLLEMSADGSRVLWEWWAHEHGFAVDHFGDRRVLDKKEDHREILYPTWLHTAHVNSAIELPDGSIAATFFMQGIVGNIDRASGEVVALVENLQRPHALRTTSKGNVTFADTARGVAHLLTSDFKPLQDVSIDTNWLQDCQLHDGMWILVDAQHARVYFADDTGTVFAYDQFDENWDFFEVAIAE